MKNFIFFPKWGNSSRKYIPFYIKWSSHNHALFFFKGVLTVLSNPLCLLFIIFYLKMYMLCVGVGVSTPPFSKSRIVGLSTSPLATNLHLFKLKNGEVDSSSIYLNRKLGVSTPHIAHPFFNNFI